MPKEKLKILRFFLTLTLQIPVKINGLANLVHKLIFKAGYSLE